MTEQEISSKLKARNIIPPVVLGLLVVTWLFSREFDPSVLKGLALGWKTVGWLFVAVLFMIGRDLGYIIRIRVLSDNDLTWKQSFRIIILWEFVSAISPSTIGGTSVAVVFLHKEGISVGRSTSVVLATSFLDELYFVIMFPLLVLIIGWKNLFTTSLTQPGSAFANEILMIAVIGYIIKTAWVLVVGYGLFFKPVAIRNLIVSIFRISWLKRWRKSAEKAGNDIIDSSMQLRSRGAGFWGKTLLATFLSWTSRYWVVNAILLAFFSVGDHLLIFARQLVMWIMMILSPTPGGSGLAEFIFKRYLSDFIPVDSLELPTIALAMALIWRLISYYPYLTLGAIIAPGWIQRKFIKRRKKRWYFL